MLRGRWGPRLTAPAPAAAPETGTGYGDAGTAGTRGRGTVKLCGSIGCDWEPLALAGTVGDGVRGCRSPGSCRDRSLHPWDPQRGVGWGSDAGAAVATGKISWPQADLEPGKCPFLCHVPPGHRCHPGARSCSHADVGTHPLCPAGTPKPSAPGQQGHMLGARNVERVCTSPPSGGVWESPCPRPRWLCGARLGTDPAWLPHLGLHSGAADLGSRYREPVQGDVGRQPRPHPGGLRENRASSARR